MENGTHLGALLQVIKEPANTGREMAILLWLLPLMLRFLPWLRTNQIHQVFELLQCNWWIQDNFDDVSALFDDGNPEVKAAVVEMLGLHPEEKSARSLIKEG